jgi:hypothetical protein
MRVFLTCDGEHKQIEVFQDADLLQAFEDALIDFGKTPASCSAICQSSDASPFFRAIKKKLKSACELGKEAYECRILKDGLKRTLDGILSFSSAKKEVVCDSLMKVVWAIRETITLEMVKKGYKVIGQYPIDFSAAMSGCTRSLSLQEANTMKDKEAGLLLKFRTTGILTESDMDEAGIPESSG